jgi:hypothetical protein
MRSHEQIRRATWNVAGHQADECSRSHSEENREHTNGQGKPRTHDDVAQDVAAQRVGTEEMTRTRTLEHTLHVVSQRVVRGQARPENGEDDRHADDHRSDADLENRPTDGGHEGRRPHRQVR